MRQIKFRALCNVDCKEGDNITKMVYFSQLELDNGLWFNPDDENIHHINEWLTKPMQFTGLTDKNGVDIYEGDVLEHEYGGILKVVFNEGKFKIQHKENEGDKFPVFSDIGHVKFCKVIGNIYQDATKKTS